MNNTELDQLIVETIERDETLKAINKNILSHIQKSHRHAVLGKVIKMIAIAFGCPLIFATYCWTTYNNAAHSNFSTVALCFIGLTVVILFISLSAIITKIHAEDL